MWRVQIRCQKCSKKVFKIFGSLLQNTLSLHPLWESSMRASQSGVLKKFWKKLQNIWRVEKFALSLHPLSPQKRKHGSEKKKFENFSKKIWWFGKKVLPLHHFPPLKWRTKLERFWRPRRARKVLTIKIEQRSLKIFEQQSFSTLEKEWFQKQYLWDLSERFNNSIFFTMESLILAQDER